ncbi:MAG: hypothetical protein ABW000_12445 [Actinoplanes sp.]
MIEDQDIQDRFKVAEVPPTRLTTTAVVGAGRRRATRRRALRAGGGVALAAALAVAVPSFVARAGGHTANLASGGDIRTVRCAATNLLAPTGVTEVYPEAVDPSGRYILGNTVTRRGEAVGGKAVGGKGEDVDMRAVLWTDGQPQALPLIGASVRASAVNAQGTVAGVAGDGDGQGRWDSVIRYTGGVPEKLTAPPGDWKFSPLVKVDAAGNVLAVASPEHKPHDYAVLVWKAGSATATRLTLPTGIETINVTDAGTVIGSVKSSGATYVWDQQGGRRQLATSRDGAANFAHRGDWVTANLGSSGTVVRWDVRTGEMTDTGLHEPANGVNALGWILGGTTVQRDDAVVDLAGAGGLTATPRDVSDTGLVIGSMYAYGTPSTEPSPSTNPSTNPSSAPGQARSGMFSWQCAR